MMNTCKNQNYLIIISKKWSIYIYIQWEWLCSSKDDIVQPLMLKYVQQ